MADQNAQGIAEQLHGPGAASLPSAGKSGFASRLDLPVAWERLDGPPSERLRQAIEHSNAAILAFLLRGIDLEAAPRAGDERLVEALAPLRAKLDTIIELLARLSYRDVELPPRCSIELGDRQIAWQADREERGGSWLRIKIYFDATFRDPVAVYGRVSGCVQTCAGGKCRIEADLAEISEPVLGGLARLALLIQRRQRAPHAAAAATRGK